MKQIAMSNKLIILLMFGVQTFSASAQQTSWNVGFSSGLFKFIGASTEKTTLLITSTNGASAYTNNPYGNNYALCYGVTGGVERTSKSKWKFGTEMGYELRRSMINVDQVSLRDGLINATGKSFLKLNTFNLFPYFGHGFNINKTSWDLVAGVEMSYIANAIEKGNATDINQVHYSSYRDRTNIHFDWSPSIKLNCRYKQIGWFAGYSAGTNNYLKNYIGGVNSVYGRLMRFGMKWNWDRKKFSKK